MPADRQRMHRKKNDNTTGADKSGNTVSERTSWGKSPPTYATWFLPTPLSLSLPPSVSLPAYSLTSDSEKGFLVESRSPARSCSQYSNTRKTISRLRPTATSRSRTQLGWEILFRSWISRSEVRGNPSCFSLCKITLRGGGGGGIGAPGARDGTFTAKRGKIGATPTRGLQRLIVRQCNHHLSGVEEVFVSEVLSPSGLGGN